MKTARLASSLLFAAAALVHAGKPDGGAPEKAAPSPLEGTWTLVAADLLHPDGTRTRDYGESPSGRLMVDAAGRYALQIYKAERPRFANADKAKGTAVEFEAAAMGSSTHFGTLTLDPATHQLTVHIEHSAFPNWEGTTQVRQYTLEGEVLSYQVPVRADGNIPLSVWRRLK
jgi:Lipocalin-like domain